MFHKNFSLLRNIKTDGALTREIGTDYRAEVPKQGPNRRGRRESVRKRAKDFRLLGGNCNYESVNGSIREIPECGRKLVPELDTIGQNWTVARYFVSNQKQLSLDQRGGGARTLRK
jgi:hypothetical protein